MPTNIDHALRWWAHAHGDRPMIVQSGDAVSYAELDRWVGRTARMFTDRGLVAGDRVVIIADNCMAWCVALLAAMRNGAIGAGVSTRLVRSELDWIVGDYRPRLIVHDAAAADRATGQHGAAAIATAEIDTLRSDGNGGGDGDVAATIDQDDVAAIITTSGSTARPKGVMFTHRAIVEHNSWQVIYDPLHAPYRRLVVAPMSTSAGTFPFLHTLLAGGTAYLESRFDAEQALDLIVREKVNFVTGAPIFFQRMADLPAFAAADVAHLAIAHTGGATVVRPLLEAWAAKGVILRQMYGQTECGGTGIVNSREHALQYPDRCGGGMMFTDVAIIDAAGNFLPPGEQGEIVLCGPGMMKGYWGNPEATAAALVDGWLRTGDIGELDERGLLRFIDRMKDIIISGGLNISAAEVERVILELDGVEEVAVIAAKDDRFAEVAMAIVHGPAIPETAAIIAHCDRNLSNFKVPRYLIRYDEPLPRLASGKIAKPALREAHGGDNPLPPRVR
ncbi:long-chain fatty acid--CoA ligase [Sphingomonas sp. CL5.1]|uniref:class I adenylate-forming enzyme family protein n=1 Tax=Sphingomonas sp. CL5.1 TaxID=2653203 RepID=UPI00158299FB|nr:AMP-binding protein [Sphingomonas sp. CL5.1]QKR98400.1 long-chain fatty acid--CoA ligase [Sphingomonas sp. CL5.1]